MKKSLLNKDIFDIFNLFELELYKLRNLSKTEQMKMRKRIDAALNPVLRSPIEDPSEVLRLIEDRLHDILKLFRDRDNFIKEFSEMLDNRLLSGEERAFAQAINLDPKLMRTQLDEVGLPRSSQVRVVLARVLRDSIDAKEFLAAVNREALTVADPEEKKNLMSLKDNKSLSFMSDIIELLLEKI
jgi:hypothetical protein